jgi:hypothetical protein
MVFDINNSKINLLVVLSSFSKPHTHLLCTLSAISHGQLCTGSLGDPAANITFGSGPNPGPPLPVGKTSYQYANNACPVNGDYTILNRGVECNYDWHVLPSDHSGMPGGYFMLVDASFEPGDFYVDTVTTLCVNTTYEFAAWMLNMKKVLQGTGLILHSASKRVRA